MRGGHWGLCVAEEAELCRGALLGAIEYYNYETYLMTLFMMKCLIKKTSCVCPLMIKNVYKIFAVDGKL